MRLLPLLLFLLLPLLTHAEHRPNLTWMQGYTGANGQGCCNKLDCRHVTTAIRFYGPDGAHVLIEDHGRVPASVEIVIPETWVHDSKDGHTYWCFVAQFESTGMYGAPSKVVMPWPPTRENTRCVFVTSGG